MKLRTFTFLKMELKKSLNKKMKEVDPEKLSALLLNVQGKVSLAKAVVVPTSSMTSVLGKIIKRNFFGHATSTKCSESDFNDFLRLFITFLTFLKLAVRY